MIVVVGTLKLTEVALASLREAARTVIAATREEAGCIHYSFAADLAEPGVVRIYEEWESREALRAHGAAAHIETWRGALREAGVGGADLKLVDVERFEPFA